MTLFIITAFLLALITVIVAVIKAASSSMPKVLRWSYWLWFVVAAGICVFTTFYYTYYTNSNTRFHGWPIPTVVFQRDDADSPWLDFVGPTTLLAYPMNLTTFLVVPSVILLVWCRFKCPNNKTAEQDSANQSTTTPWVEILMKIMNLNLKLKFALR